MNEMLVVDINPNQYVIGERKQNPPSMSPIHYRMHCLALQINAWLGERTDGWLGTEPMRVMHRVDGQPYIDPLLAVEWDMLSQEDFDAEYGDESEDDDDITYEPR